MSNKKCDYGCGREAKYQFDNGKWCCSESHNSCPAIRKKNSERCKNRERVECQYCGKKFTLHNIRRHERCCEQNPDKNEPDYMECQYCGKEIQKTLLPMSITNLFQHEKTCPYNPENKTYCKECGDLITSKDAKKYCNRSCAASYNNKHKTTGVRRSKLEKWIEEQLTEDFPELDIRFNDRELLDGLELDVYIPDLRFAVEINGIFHYEPIYDEDKFNKRVDRDNQKQRLCNEEGVELMVVNTSEQGHFSSESSRKYYKVIKEQIQKIGARTEEI